MKITTTTYTVGDYCEMLLRKDVRVNREYQRSELVWPTTAKAFLIDTILLGFPIPKLSLYQTRDQQTGKLFRDIVDGQQRSEAILSFKENELRLGKNIDTENARGRTFAELEPELQQQFIEYPLSVDLFLSATQEEIRDVFRRINSYTVPLNPEEQRHAKYQGPFKWFIFELTRRYDRVWLDIGTFTEKALIRMADAKLLTEVVHAMFHGISTTNKGKLEQIYLDKNREFAEIDECTERIANAITFIAKLTPLHGGPLMLQYQMYALLLAVMHLQRPIDKLQNVFSIKKPARLKGAAAAEQLSVLADALETSDVPESDPRFTFVEASQTRTNVKSQRELRFQWFCRALLGNVLEG